MGHEGLSLPSCFVCEISKQKRHCMKSINRFDQQLGRYELSSLASRELHGLIQDHGKIF